MRWFWNRRGLNEVWDSSCAWSRWFVAMFKVELVGVLAHCFWLELGAAEPTFIFGMVSLATKRAVKIVLFDCRRRRGATLVLFVLEVFLHFVE